MIDIRRFSYGGPAAIVTGMGLIVGLDAATVAKGNLDRRTVDQMLDNRDEAILDKIGMRGDVAATTS